MKFVTLFVGIGLVAASSTAAATHCAQPNTNTIASVVRISDSNGITASGVVVGENLVLTAAHAIDVSAVVSISPDGGSKRVARVLAMDEYADLALLEADTTSIPTMLLGDRAVGRGDTVWAAGYPNNTAMHVSEGPYTKARGDRMEVKAWIDSGHSGGALFACENGIHKLAGIVHGYIAKRGKKGYVNTGRHVSISLASVNDFLAR